jgi:4-diphosphocytidyl-2-C-methyl-D-erythritol kinase
LPVPLLEENAPAKVNLTLRVLGRRADGYHELESLVAFADVADRLALAPGRALALEVRGPNAAQAGADADNLVLKAANALAGLIPGLTLGAFALEKKLPVAAGIGGGSTDAAAALRLLARANNLAGDDPRVFAAARATGADVPVCLDPRTRLMRGIGEKLSAPLKLPRLAAVLVNPRVAVATKDVFAGWKPVAGQGASLDASALAQLADPGQFLQFLQSQANDLETPAVALAPVIAEALAALRALPGCGVARMSGSGATCFALMSSATAAAAAAKAMQGKFPDWWVRACALGG